MTSLDKSDPLWYDRQQKKPTRQEACVIDAIISLIETVKNLIS